MSAEWLDVPLTPQQTDSSERRKCLFSVPQYVLDDLCSRFIINIPEEERSHLIRVFFQIELAHWFYLDFYCQEKPELKPIGIRDFSAQIFKHCPFLRDHLDNIEDILKDWKTYKLTVPTYGAILLNPELTHCLLVQGFWNKSSWGFPKGKVNKDELPHICAVREVAEETGLDIKDLINENEFIEHTISDQLARIYIVHNIPFDTQFKPKTRGEIKDLQWFPVDSLPTHKKDLVCKTNLNLNPNAFFMIMPFVKPLKKWISKKLGHESTISTKKTFKPVNADTKQLQKLKQQQLFAQQNQSEFLDYQQHAVKTDSSKSHSPIPRFQKTKQNTSPKKSYQVLNRDGSLSGKARRSLATQFTYSPLDHELGQKDSKSKKEMDPATSGGWGSTSGGWPRFKFDEKAIMNCFY